MQRCFLGIADDIQTGKARIHIEPGNAHAMIVIPEQCGLLVVGIVTRGELTGEGGVLSPAIAHRCRPTTMEMHDGPGWKRRHSLIDRSPTTSRLIL